MIEHVYKAKCPWCNPEIVDRAHERAMAQHVEDDHTEALKMHRTAKVFDAASPFGPRAALEAQMRYAQQGSVGLFPCGPGYGVSYVSAAWPSSAYPSFPSSMSNYGNYARRR